jgi:hypothetical protein
MGFEDKICVLSILHILIIFFIFIHFEKRKKLCVLCDLCVTQKKKLCVLRDLCVKPKHTEKACFPTENKPFYFEVLLIRASVISLKKCVRKKI